MVLGVLVAPQGAGHGAAPPGKLCGSRVPAPGRCRLGPAALPNSSARRVPGLELNLPAAAKEKPPPQPTLCWGEGLSTPAVPPGCRCPRSALVWFWGPVQPAPAPRAHACMSTRGCARMRVCKRCVHVDARTGGSTLPRRQHLSLAAQPWHRHGEATRGPPGMPPPQSVCPCGGQEDSPGPTLPRGTGGQPRTLTPRAPYHFPWQLPPRQLRFRSGAAAEPAGYL